MYAIVFQFSNLGEIVFSRFSSKELAESVLEKFFERSDSIEARSYLKVVKL